MINTVIDGEPTGSTTSSDRSATVDPAHAARPQLYVVLESERPLAPTSRHLLAEVDEVIVGRGSERVAVREGRRLILRIADRRLSREHARLVRARHTWLLEDLRSRNGTLIDGVPVHGRRALRDGEVVEAGGAFLLYRELLAPIRADVADLLAEALDPPEPTLATFAASLAESFANLAKIAPRPVTVVILGPTGSGKEVVARALHALSGRPGAFVGLNCGALPRSILEALLFGHRRGAFSGAVDERPGLVRSADGGTLFLDEIADLPIDSQTAFLRVLQEREVVPIGDVRPVPVDLRLCAATHQDLEARVAAGEFRNDLLARMSGLTVRLPPLVERREDFGLLVGALLRRAGVPGVTFTPRAARALFQHAWPLNVRELEKALETAVSLADDGRVDVGHLPEGVRPRGGAAPGPPLPDDERQRRDEIVALLQRHGGNVAEVARALGKGRMQIHRWARRFGIVLDRYRR